MAETQGTVVGDDGLARPPWAAHDPLLRTYYDTEWGMPVRDERGLFERLSLEAFQSGLSWATILRKRPAFREAFAGFDPDAVAGFDDADIARLLADARIVRNRAKILATVGNARATVSLRERGGLAELIWSSSRRRRPDRRLSRRSPRSRTSRVRSPAPCGARVSGSWDPRRCSPSWRRWASSTRISWDPTGGGHPGCGTRESLGGPRVSSSDECEVRNAGTSSARCPGIPQMVGLAGFEPTTS